MKISRTSSSKLKKKNAKVQVKCLQTALLLASSMLLVLLIAPAATLQSKHKTTQSTE